MRNLKKVLSLALALVMLLGMMVVGAGAVTLNDYGDKAGISETYLEAVDLLTAINVLEGNQGNFSPAGTLTREQAAKIVATLALGVDAAEALSTSAAPFTDVSANRWSAGYIAYCANMGIVSGIGNGKFNPLGEVSGYQFAKMLLGALGYNANHEYEGSNWVLNVSRDAVTVGVSRKVNISNASLTREEAAQMAFNTITTNLVSYSSLIGTYTQYAWGTNAQTLLGTLAKNIFNVQKVDDEDGYGYDIHHWSYIGRKEAITAEYKSGSLLGTETNPGLSLDGLFRNYSWNNLDASWTAARPAPLDYKGVELYVNGTACKFDTSPLINDASATAFDATTVMKGKTNVKPFEDLRGYTAYIMDEDNDGDADKIVVVIEYLAEVTRVNTNGTVTLTVYDKTGVEKNINVETTDFAQGDMVLVVPSVFDADAAAPAGLKEPLSMVKAEVANGTVTAYYTNTATNHAGGSVTMNGTKYDYNGIFAKTNEALGYDLAQAASGANYTLGKGSYNLYLDSNGNVIGAKAVEDTIGDFAYIVAVGHDYFGLENIVDVILSDGTRATYTISRRSTPASLYDTNKSADVHPGEVYAYSLDGNEIILTDLDTVSKYSDAENVSVSSNAFYRTASAFVYTDGGTKYAYVDDNTVFVYLNGNTITRFVGKDNAPNLSQAVSSGVSMALHTVGNVDYIQYVVIKAAPENAMSNNYIYVRSGVVGQGINAKNAPVYYYEVMKDGVATKIAVDVNNLTEGGVYVYSVNMDLFPNEIPNVVEAGQYSVQPANSSDILENFVVNSVASGNVAIGTAPGNGTTNVIMGNARVIDLTAKPNPVEDKVEVGDTITVVYTTAGSLKVAREVFITKRSTEQMAPSALGGTENATVDKNTYVSGNVTLGTGTYKVNAGATLTIGGNIDGNSKTIQVDGNLVVSGNVTGTITFTGTGTVTVQGTVATLGNNSTNLTVTGAITTISGNTGTIDAKSTIGSVTNGANGTVTATGLITTVAANDAAGVINANGGITTVDTNAGTINTTKNIGTVTANAGTINVNDSLTIATITACAGDIKVAAGKTLTVSNGPTVAIYEKISGVAAGAKVNLATASAKAASSVFYTAPGSAGTAGTTTPNTEDVTGAYTWGTVYTSTTATGLAWVKDAA